MSAGDSPRIRANDWSPLNAWSPDGGTPSKSVSVVIPAYRADSTLAYTLAALEAQTYPSELLEVVVVDDGDGAALSLPPIRPENTRVIRARSSWGRANACREGAAGSEGDVIHWLDADMVPCRDHVANQLRWHHLLDHAVVLGHKTFVDPENLPPVDELHLAVEKDDLECFFSGRWCDEHAWVEKIWHRTQELTTAGFRAFHVHVGATASVGRDLYLEAGGMDPDLKLGEDVELGYRLAAKGGVFIADRSARSWHLGRSTLMRHEQQVQRYNIPFIAERVPDFRKFRQDRGRMYKVPLIEVVVDATGHTHEQVAYTVNGVLQAAPSDLRCLIVGAWSHLSEERRHPLHDPLLESRLVKEEYSSEARVEFVETLAPTAFPALFRMHCPVGWRPGETTMDSLTRDMQKRAHGLRSVLLPDGQVVRLERTAAFERALKVRREGEDLDDALEDVASTWWSEGLEDGFVHLRHAADGGRPRSGPSKPEPQSSEVTQPATPSAARLRSTARRLGLGKVRDAVRNSTLR